MHITLTAVHTYHFFVAFGGVTLGAGTALFQLDPERHPKIRTNNQTNKQGGKEGRKEGRKEMGDETETGQEELQQTKPTNLLSRKTTHAQHNELPAFWFENKK